MKSGSNVVELFAFPFDLETSQLHLRQDMRDDWFPDPLLYEELFSDHASACEVISSLLEQANGRYPASSRVLRDIPKAGLGLRYSLETDFYDRLIYQGLCSYLLPFYDPLLSHRVLSHRFDEHARKKKYLFKNRIELWKTYEGLTHLCISEGGVLLATDLVNYFENISRESVISSLSDLLPEVSATGTQKARLRNAIATLDDLLQYWCYRPGHGLPQNRDASSFLANVVLDKVDRRMVERGYDYYRYVDDIRICCSSEYEARSALSALIEELRAVGMNINGAKTSLLSAESENLDDFFPGLDDRVAVIDNMWRSRSKRVISRSVPLLKEMLIEAIESRSTQSRQFRFLVNRVRKLLDADVFDCSSLLTTDFLDLIFDAFDGQAASTDQFCSVLRRVPLSSPIFKKIECRLLSAEKPLYFWQNHHLWMLLAEVSYVTEPLVDKAFELALEANGEALLGALFIYLGSAKAKHHLRRLVTNFGIEWSFQDKRLFLIACQDMQDELKSLVPEMDVRLRGTIVRIRKNSSTKGRYILRPEPTPIDELYDEISPYL